MSDDYIFGIRTILEAQKSNTPIQKVFIQKGLKSNLIQTLESQLRQQKISISYVPEERFRRFKNQNHQGAAALISPVTYADYIEKIDACLKQPKRAFFLLLDHITDVRNFGAILRTANSAGVDAVIIPSSGMAPITSESVKSSSGALFTTSICRSTHIKDVIYYLQGSGVKVIAATEKAEQNIYDEPLDDHIAIVMGSEDKGIHPSILKLVDAQAKLPMLGKVDSLNVSVACGLFLYEVVRQRL